LAWAEPAAYLFQIIHCGLHVAMDGPIMRLTLYLRLHKANTSPATDSTKFQMGSLRFSNIPLQAIPKRRNLAEGAAVALERSLDALTVVTSTNSLRNPAVGINFMQ
jgi:hypothetical protein